MGVYDWTKKSGAANAVGVVPKNNKPWCACDQATMQKNLQNGKTIMIEHVDPLTVLWGIGTTLNQIYDELWLQYKDVKELTYLNFANQWC